MSRSLNKVQLIGNAGAAPEVRATSSGTRVAKLRLATNRTWKDPEGRQIDETDWHQLVFFGRLADVVEAHIAKGDRLYVEGRLHYSTSQRDDATTSYWTEIVVQDLVMLGSPRAEVKAVENRAEPAGKGRLHDDLQF